MDSKYLLNDIQRYAHVKIDSRLVEQIDDFKQLQDISCLESVALVMNGNRPIQEYRFSNKLLSDWCDKNGFEFFKDEFSREYQFRIRNMDNKKKIIQLQIDGLNQELIYVINEYCNKIGCKKCPSKNPCEAWVLEEKIYNLEKQLRND